MLLVLSMELFCLNQTIFWDSKDLVTDDGSAKLVDTNLSAVLVEQYHNDLCQYCPTLSTSKISMYLEDLKNVSVYFKWKKRKAEVAYFK